MKKAVVAILLVVMLTACSASQHREAESIALSEVEGPGSGGECKTIVIE